MRMPLGEEAAIVTGMTSALNLHAARPWNKTPQ
jgi:hypothetical protein